MFSSFKRFNFVLTMLRGQWQLGNGNPMGNIGETICDVTDVTSPANWSIGHRLIVYLWYTMSKGEKLGSITKKQKVRKLTRKIIQYFVIERFVNNCFPISAIISNKNKNSYWETKKKTWTVNILNPNKQRNIHQFQVEYRISGALYVLLLELHLSFTKTKNKEQQGQFGLIQLMLGCMHSAINN